MVTEYICAILNHLVCGTLLQADFGDSYTSLSFQMAHFILYYVLLELSEQNELGGIWVPDSDLNLVKSPKPCLTCSSWSSSLLTFGAIIIHDSMPRTVQMLPYLVLFNSY